MVVCTNILNPILDQIHHIFTYKTMEIKKDALLFSVIHHSIWVLKNSGKFGINLTSSTFSHFKLLIMHANSSLKAKGYNLKCTYLTRFHKYLFFISKNELIQRYLVTITYSFHWLRLCLFVENINSFN